MSKFSCLSFFPICRISFIKGIPHACFSISVGTKIRKVLRFLGFLIKKFEDVTQILASPNEFEVRISGRQATFKISTGSFDQSENSVMITIIRKLHLMRQDCQSNHLSSDHKDPPNPPHIPNSEFFKYWTNFSVESATN